MILLKKYISKQILIVNFTSTKPYSNNKIKIAFTCWNARVFFFYEIKTSGWVQRPQPAVGSPRCNMKILAQLPADESVTPPRASPDHHSPIKQPTGWVKSRTVEATRCRLTRPPSGRKFKRNDCPLRWFNVSKAQRARCHWRHPQILIDPLARMKSFVTCDRSDALPPLHILADSWNGTIHHTR